MIAVTTLCLIYAFILAYLSVKTYCHKDDNVIKV